MNEEIHAHLKHAGGYKFDVTFDEWSKGKLTTDESEPLGKSEGATAAMMLASAVGHCLSSSLIFCLEKSRTKAKDLVTDVDLKLARNDKGRWRVESIKVALKPSVDDVDREKLRRCIGMFQDFCIVSASVRQGIKIDVEVEERGS